jgi:hypothetical protein
MRNLDRKGVAVPGRQMYDDFYNVMFCRSWITANGALAGAARSQHELHAR